MASDGHDSSPESDASEYKPSEQKRRKNVPPTAARPRIHRCPYEGCGRSFDRPSSLTQHIYTHTGERPHLCTLCEQRRFSTTSNLYRHMRSCKLPRLSATTGDVEEIASNVASSRVSPYDALPGHRAQVHPRGVPSSYDRRLPPLDTQFNTDHGRSSHLGQYAAPQSAGSAHHLSPHEDTYYYKDPTRSVDTQSESGFSSSTVDYLPSSSNSTSSIQDRIPTLAPVYQTSSGHQMPGTHYPSSAYHSTTSGRHDSYAYQPSHEQDSRYSPQAYSTQSSSTGRNLTSSYASYSASSRPSSHQYGHVEAYGSSGGPVGVTSATSPHNYEVKEEDAHYAHHLPPFRYDSSQGIQHRGLQLPPLTGQAAGSGSGSDGRSTQQQAWSEEYGSSQYYPSSSRS